MKLRLQFLKYEKNKFYLERRILNILCSSEGSLCEGSLEHVPGPLQGVLDSVGEVLECTDGNTLLRGILGAAVGLGQLWYHNLDKYYQKTENKK